MIGGGAGSVWLSAGLRVPCRRGLLWISSGGVVCRRWFSVLVSLVVLVSFPTSWWFTVLVFLTGAAAGLVGFDFGQTGALFFVVVVLLPSRWC